MNDIYHTTVTWADETGKRFMRDVLTCETEKQTAEEIAIRKIPKENQRDIKCYTRNLGTPTTHYTLFASEIIPTKRDNVETLSMRENIQLDFMALKASIQQTLTLYPNRSRIEDDQLEKLNQIDNETIATWTDECLKDTNVPSVNWFYDKLDDYLKSHWTPRPDMDIESDLARRKNNADKQIEALLNQAKQDANTIINEARNEAEHIEHNAIEQLTDVLDTSMELQKKMQETLEQMQTLTHPKAMLPKELPTDTDIASESAKKTWKLAMNTNFGVQPELISHKPAKAKTMPKQPKKDETMKEIIETTVDTTDIPDEIPEKNQETELSEDPQNESEETIDYKAYFNQFIDNLSYLLNEQPNIDDISAAVSDNTDLQIDTLENIMSLWGIADYAKDVTAQFTDHDPKTITAYTVYYVQDSISLENLNQIVNQIKDTGLQKYLVQHILSRKNTPKNDAKED